MGNTSSVTDILARYIPGFGAYASQQKRRDEDASVRRFLLGRLQDCKRDLQAILSPLVDAGNFSAVVNGEKLRASIDTAQSKMRAAFEGYSSWFDQVQIDEAKLKQVVDLDNDLVSSVDRLQSTINQLNKSAPDFAEASELVSMIQQRFVRRNEILSRA